MTDGISKCRLSLPVHHLSGDYLLEKCSPVGVFDGDFVLADERCVLPHFQQTG
ncbi:MAG: hypothetical protein LBL07_07920 [Tannerella sp.]|nr:hypothetical protein [Tannerella sp.]